MSEQSPWHHLFSLSWSDVFQGTGAKVEPEKDLSAQKQLLDLVISCPPGTTLPRLPDGFEDLGLYNLVSFKSHQEPLNGWALDELVAHFVNLRKQAGTNPETPPPLSDFRRFAVCVRYPHNLFQEHELTCVQQGVYQWRHGSGHIRVVVVHQLPCEEHNAMLLLFSAKEDLLDYAARHYQPNSPQTSTLLLNLVNRYRQEEIPMPETLEEFAQRIKTEMLQEMSPEERLEGLPAEELRKRLSPDERLEGLPPEELRKHLSPQERLEGLSVEELEAQLRRLRQNGDQPPQN